MAEYCLDCWNRINDENIPIKKYVLSEDCEVCEGCGESKPVVVRYKQALPIEILRKIRYPFKLLFCPICFVYKLIKRKYLKNKIERAKRK